MHFACVFIAAALLPGASDIKTDEVVVFYPTVAYQEAATEEWVVQIHGRVFEPDDECFSTDDCLDQCREFLRLDDDSVEGDLFKSRMKHFFVDNERGKDIQIRIGKKEFELEESEPNGHFKGTLRFSEREMATLAETDRNGARWLRFEAVLRARDPRKFRGECQIVSDSGVSVISDIDDTIKLSDVNNPEALIANTFLHPYAAVDTMPAAYKAWASRGATFHYLSASPWQLYEPLSEFLDASGYPRGSFHLRHLRLFDDSLYRFIVEREEAKRPIIDDFLNAFPNRRFILVGDSSERDPETYAAIARNQPDRIVHIFLRDTSPSPASTERLSEAFKDIPPDRFTIFTDPNVLVAFWPEKEGKTEGKRQKAE